jgi:hypothetical protein
MWQDAFGSSSDDTANKTVAAKLQSKIFNPRAQCGERYCRSAALTAGLWARTGADAAVSVPCSLRGAVGGLGDTRRRGSYPLEITQ